MCSNVSHDIDTENQEWEANTSLGRRPQAGFSDSFSSHGKLSVFICHLDIMIYEYLNLRIICNGTNASVKFNRHGGEHV